MTDKIKQPKHYIANAIEPIDFIIANKLNFCEGNVIKYMLRAPHKGEHIQDLEKAKWYLDRHIENVRKSLK